MGPRSGDCSPFSDLVSDPRRGRKLVGRNMSHSCTEATVGIPLRRASAGAERAHTSSPDRHELFTQRRFGSGYVYGKNASTGRGAPRYRSMAPIAHSG
jgi:hypothetical protein